MVPNTINAMSNSVVGLQGDGTGFRAETFGFEFTLFQYQKKSERLQLYCSTTFD